MPIYYNDANIVIFVYDITRLSSFEDVKEWIGTMSHWNLAMYLVGNKVDMEEIREVGVDVGETLAEEYNLPHFEISATITDDVNQLFTKIAAENFIL